MTRYTNLPDNKHKIFGGAYGIHDPDMLAARDDLVRKYTTIDSSLNTVAEDIKHRFVRTYHDWAFRGFDLPGIDLYQHACFTQGTTESFAQFYVRYRDNRRLRINKGEYFYHQMMKSLWYNERFAWIDEDDLRANDVVLISVPFADTGDIPTDLDQLLDRCDELNIPVMLDFAYINLTTPGAFPYRIDLSRSCIKYIVTSLSKVFPVENHRIGLRLQKEKLEDQIYVVNEKNYNYINLLSAYVGVELMELFAPDYVFHKYRQQQIDICRKMKLAVSPCVNFGIDHLGKYPEYNRGGNSNRLCFSRVWDGRDKKLNLET
jgi:hypothetical protein